MLAFIPLRYQHSRRMVPLCRTQKWVCFWVSRGKAKVQGVRAGFRWFVPRVSILAQCADCVWDEWRKLQTQRCYADMPPTFICQQDGASMSLQQFNDAAQRGLHGLLEVDAPPVTSYSFRRCPPTALDCRGADWLERLQIGGWQMDAATSAEYRCRRNTMPIRYSGQREEAEVQSKALHTIILCAALNDGVSTWEDFRTRRLGRDEDQIRAWRQELFFFLGGQAWKLPSVLLQLSWAKSRTGLYRENLKLFEHQAPPGGTWIHCAGYALHDPERSCTCVALTLWDLCAPGASV